MVDDYCPECGQKQQIIFLKRGFGVEIKKFSCGHKTITEYNWLKQEDLIDTSFPVRIGKDKHILLNPVADIAQALMKDNWFEAVLFSAIYVEFFCSKLLREKGKLRPKHIKKMTFKELTEKLKSLGLISEDTYYKINKVRKIRNGVVHDPREMLTLNKNIALKTVELTFEILKELDPYFESAMNELRKMWQV